MKKIIAILLSLSMITVFMPTFAFATVAAETIKDTDITITGDTTYTGSQITPTVVVRVNGNELTQGATGTECTVTYGTNTVAGTGTVTVKGNAPSYSGTVTKNFTIKQKNISTLSASISPKIVGTSLLINDINIKYGNMTLGSADISFDPYTTKAGTNPVTVKGTGNYTGQLAASYEGGLDFSGYEIVPAPGTPSTYTYTGDPIKCAYTVRDKKTQIPLDTSCYSELFTNNQNVGDATLTLTGVKGVVGTLQNTKIFTITPRDFNYCSIDTIENTLSGVQPVVTVRDGYLNKVVDPSNYTVTAKTEITPSGKTIGTIKVTGKDNYTGTTLQTTYQVANQTLNGYITLSQRTYDYDGYDHKPSITVRDNQGKEIPYYAYRIDWPKDMGSAGVKTIKVVGVGDYAGIITADYTINQKNIVNCSATLSITSYEYIGSPITPEVTVQDTYRYMTKDIDYKLSYSSNVSKGTASITVTGIGNYTGTKTLSFYIGGTNINRGTVTLSQYNYQYTGNEARPTVTVKYGYTTVSPYDYEVTYKNNINAGTATAVVTGKNGYSGTIETNFYISGKDLNACTATLSQDAYTADGYAKTPYVTVKNGYTTLSQNTDYTVSYENNTIAGMATVIIKGKGGYTGSIVKTFKIIGTPQTITTDFTRYTKYLSSDDFTIRPYATGDGTGFSFTSSDTSVVKVTSFGNVTVVGTGVATITVKTIGVKKSEPVEKVITVTVKPSRAVYTVTSPSYSKMKVRITKAPGVTKYQIRYGRNGNYKNSYYTYSNSYYDTQSRTFTGLRSGSKYYVKVRAYKTMADGQKAWGNWGTIKAVRIK